MKDKIYPMDFDILQKWFNDNPTFKNQKPQIIKLADLRDVIDKIDKGEITMSKGAEY